MDEFHAKIEMQADDIEQVITDLMELGFTYVELIQLFNYLAYQLITNMDYTEERVKLQWLI